MAQFEVRRFDDTRLGDMLPVVDAARLGATSDWSALARRFVQDWAGQGARVSGSRVAAASAGHEITELAGCVYARHLDDSHNVDVKVIGSTRRGAKIVDIVRVQLR